MSEWLQSLHRIGERGLDAVLVAVLSGSGSTPRDAGAKMVVARCQIADHGGHAGQGARSRS